ncbi:hypothetical protein [Neptuniibacter sp. QD37_11]|uniref:hypothetical protein n=1 Tax=Neptuniibacter sp. QD37_11 TaxID=3398209 RepID=UPI0039F6266B
MEATDYISLNGPDVDLVGLVLDALGFPSDNTVELNMDISNPELCCRDMLYNKWHDLLEEGVNSPDLVYLAWLQDELQTDTWK